MRKLLSWKKLVLLALCVCMIFTFAACANKNDNGGGNSIQPLHAEFGQVKDDPTEALQRVAYALFPTNTIDKGSKLNLGFNADVSLALGNNKFINTNVDLRLSVDRQNNENSKFSLVIMDKSDSIAQDKKILLGAYFDGDILIVDMRGLTGACYSIDTDIGFFINLIASALGNSNLSGQIENNKNMIAAALPIIGKSMSDKGALKVYEKVNPDTGAIQVTTTFYVKKTIQYFVDFLNGKVYQGGIFDSIIAMLGDSVGQIKSVLTNLYNKIPENATINLGLGVIGAGTEYYIADASLFASASNLNLEFNALDFSTADQSNQIQSPIDLPEDLKPAYGGSLKFDVGLDISISDGMVSIADIDKAMGGILNSFVSDLDQSVDFSNNYIKVEGNPDLKLRASVAFQLSLKNNNDTNFLIEIYFDKNNNEKNDPGEALLQFYYKGEEQAFYLDLSGLGKSDMLPNKIKITKDLDGNSINLTSMFTNYIKDLVMKGGQMNLTELINKIIGVVTGLFSNEPSAQANGFTVTDEQIAEINNKFMTGELIIPTIATADGGTSIDALAIVKIILQEIQWDYKQSAGGADAVFYGFTIEISQDMFSQIFDMIGVDVSLLKAASLGVHVTPETGLSIDLKVNVDAHTAGNDVTETEIKNFPKLELGLHIGLDLFTSFDKDRLPKDTDGTWQTLTLKRRVDEDNKLDLMNSVLATLAGKKIYFSAAAQFRLDLTDSNGDVNIGANLDRSIGGAIGAALADLQLRTGQLNVKYTLELLAHIDLGSFINMDTKADVLSIIKSVVGDQEICIKLKAERNGGKEEEVLALLLSKGALYLDAEKLGIPKTKIETKELFESIEGLLSTNQTTPVTTAADDADKSAATIKTVIALLSNIDVLTIMEDEIAISLNCAFLNVLLPMLVPSINGQGEGETGTVDLTMSYIGAAIKFNSDIFTKDEANASLLNKLAIEIKLGTNFGGAKVDLALAVGGLNIGLVDTSINDKYDIDHVFWNNDRDSEKEKFVNPMQNSLLTFGMTGKLGIIADGEFTFNGKRMEGEIGALLSNLALVLGADNLNKTFTLNLMASIDLHDFVSNESQLSLELTDETNNLIAGIYVYNKYIYVDIPQLFKPFRVEFDLVNLIYDLIEGRVEIPKAPANGTAYATADPVSPSDALCSVIQIYNKSATVRMSSDMLKGIAVALVGKLSETNPDGTPGAIDPATGEEVIALIKSLPFDIMIIAGVSFDGDKSLLENMSIDLKLYLGENLADTYVPGSGALDEPVVDKPKLALNLSGLFIKYMPNGSILPAIEKTFKNNRFDDMASISSIENLDVSQLLANTKASVSLDGYFGITSNGTIVSGSNGISNDLILYLNDIIGTLPEIMIRIGAMQSGSADLAKIYFHLAVSADIGAILNGDYNRAVELSLGLYRNKFVDYDTSASDKILSIVVLSNNDDAGNASCSAYLDCQGLASSGSNNGLLTGKLKLENLDLTEIIGKLGIQEAQAASKDDIVKLNGIVGIINDAISAISVSNEGIAIDLGTNIIGVLINLITKNDDSVNGNAFPLTDGKIELVTKEYMDAGGNKREPGLFASIGLKNRDGGETALALSLGIQNLEIAFSKLSGSFLYGANDFVPSEFYAVNQLRQISVAMDLGFDIDLNEGVHNLNLFNKYAGMIGNLQYLFGQNDVKNLVVDETGAAKDLFLGITIQGQIGLANPLDTEIKILLTTYPTKADRIAKTNGKSLLNVYLYKDSIYIKSDILNINNMCVKNTGISKIISDSVNGIFAGLPLAESTAISTAGKASGADFLIGNKQIDIMISSELIQSLLGMIIQDNPELTTMVNSIIAGLVKELKLNLDLSTMSAKISLFTFLNESEKADLKDTLLDVELSINGLEVSVWKKNFIAENEINEADYQEAVKNGYAELSASVTIDREPVTEILPNNIFGKLAGVIDHIDGIDADIRGVINNILQSLYIYVVNQNDDGMSVTLNAFLQVNIDWNSLSSLDLNRTSIRLLLTDTNRNTIVDAYLIGSNDTLYIDAPVLGLTENGKSLTKLAIKGINLIELYEQSQQAAKQQKAISTADNSGIAEILNIINGMIGGVNFSGDGFSVGLAPTFLNAIAAALGLIPSLDSGLVDAISQTVACLPETDSSSGIYVKYPTVNDNTTSPVVGLRYGLKDVGSIAIELNHYAIGIINDLSNPGNHPFKDIEGIKKLTDFSQYDKEYSKMAQYQNIQFSMFGQLKMGVTETAPGGLDLSKLVDGVIGAFLPLLPLDFATKISSDINDSATLTLKVEGNIDLSYILDNLQIGVTIYKNDNVINHKDIYNENNDILLAVYYDKGDLLIKAPDYFDGVAKLEGLVSLFSNLLSAADSQNEIITNGITTVDQKGALLEIIFGKEFVGVHITGEIFGILCQILQAQNINLTEDMFASIKDQFDIGIEIGSLNSDGHLTLSEMYASLGLTFGPINLGIRVQEPKVAVSTMDSIVPDGWKEQATSIYNVVFKIGAEGKLGLVADNSVLDLNALLKDFGVNAGLDFDVNLEDALDNTKKPLNLHLGLTVDAEICLGDLSKCKLALVISVYDQKDGTKIGNLAEIYLNDKSLYLDLKNEIIDITEVHIDTDSMTKIIDELKSLMNKDDAGAVTTNGALTTDGTIYDSAVIRNATRTLSNLILLSFNNAKGADGAPLNELGSITAEVGAGVINQIFDMLGLSSLSKGNFAASIQIDVPNSTSSNFGIGLNVTTDGESAVIKNAGLYLWIGNIYVKKSNLTPEEAAKYRDCNPPKELINNAIELSDIAKQYITLDLSASLAMMKSQVDPVTDEDGNPNDNHVLIKNPITEFFKGFLPWMPDFLAQLEIIDKNNTDPNSPLNIDNFMSNHTIRLQANINLGMLINSMTCLNCKKDFTGQESDYVNKKICPHCGASIDKLEKRGFYLSDLDLAITFNRISEKNNVKTVTPLLGVYIEDSQIAFYGEEFGLNNFVIDKESAEDIADSVKELIGKETAQGNSSTALSTADDQTSGGSNIDILSLLGKAIEKVYISMYCVRVVIDKNILSYIPELTESLGIKGFPEYGYPILNENNYIQIGLIQNQKIDLSLTLNLDMFGMNISLGISDVSIGLGAPKTIDMPEAFASAPDADGNRVWSTNTQKLDRENSILDIRFETEVRIDFAKADTQLSALLGGLLGDLTAGYKNDEDFYKNFLLRVRIKIDIANFRIVAGVEIIDQEDTDDDGYVDKQTTVLGVFYDSNDGTAYIKSSILPDLKVTGINMQELLAKAGLTTALATADIPSGQIRPILNSNILENPTNQQAVKVTLAMQQYFAAVVTGELINQIINGIDVMNNVPTLPDFEIGIKIGRDPALAIQLEVGIKGRMGVESAPGEGDEDRIGYLVKLTACVYLSPLDSTNPKAGGTYISFMNREESNKPENIVITEEMRNYPEFMEIDFNEKGELAPIFKVDRIKLDFSIFVKFAYKQGEYNFSDFFGDIFGKDNEFTALVKALEDSESHYELRFELQVSVQNLIMGIFNGDGVSLDGTSAKITLIDTANKKNLFQLTFIGGGGQNGNDAIYIRLFGVEGIDGTGDLAIKVDTISIMDIVNQIQNGSSSSAISTANSTTKLADFINSIVKDVHITHPTYVTGGTYRRININFQPRVFDSLLQLITILTAETSNATTDTILELLGKLNLPSVTSGGLFLEFREDANGIGIGLDVEFNNSFTILAELELSGLSIVDDTSCIKVDDAQIYKNLNDFQMSINFRGYVDINNSSSPAPISLGSLITSIMDLLNVNIGNVEFDLNTTNTEKYEISLDAYLDTTDFILNPDGSSDNSYNSVLRLGITKTSANRELLACYLDLNRKAVMLDLSGLSLPKVYLSNLDLAGMLAQYISPYLGGGEAAASAESDSSTFSANKLSSILYLTLGKNEMSLRFNADLINAILSLIFSYVSIPDMDLSNIKLPDIGEIEVGMYDKNTGDTDTRKHFEVRFKRDADNYMAIGVTSFTCSVGKLTNLDSYRVSDADFGNYAKIYDLEKGLTLKQIYVDASISLTLDFTDSEKATAASSFTRYISRILALLIDKSEDEAAINKYQIRIVSDEDRNKKLQYQLNIKGILDINDIFGGSNLAIEIIKKDLVNGKDRMLIGAYLKTDADSDNIPSLYVNLSNLGLPKVKLVGIDKLIGGALSAGSRSNVMGTGEYDFAEAMSGSLQNNVTISDNNLSIALNKGFIYGILGAILPNVFVDGQISIGDLAIPLPNIKGVTVDVDLSQGLKTLAIKAYLEQETNNHIAIDMRLNSIELSDKGFASNKFDWNDYDLADYGSVHISTSFKADMMNSIIDSIMPNIFINMYRRGDGAYNTSGSGGGKNIKSLYEAAMNATSWQNARAGQSWNRIEIMRGQGNSAQRLQVNLLTRAGHTSRHPGANSPITTDNNRGFWNGEAGAKVYLTNGEIYANLTYALDVTSGIVGQIGNLDRTFISGGINIGNSIFGGTSAMALSGASSTADEKNPSPLDAIFANLDLSKLFKGIELTIDVGSNSGGAIRYAKTDIKVKVDPDFINDTFRAVNYLLCTIFDDSLSYDKNFTVESANRFDAIFNNLITFLGSPDIVNGMLPGLINGNTFMAATDLLNLLSAILPLPTLNPDADPNRFGECKAEVRIALDYNATGGGSVLGALRSITAEFGHDYGFGTYDNGDVNKAKEAARNNLGYFKLEILPTSAQAIDMKSVSSVKDYDKGESTLRSYAESYVAGNSSNLSSGSNQGIQINDPMNLHAELVAIIRNLPTKANVNYSDGTSTGDKMGGEDSRVFIVWDDSRIDLQFNGSSDSYLYGWIQNKLIAKIKVTVNPETYKVKSIISSGMANLSENAYVRLIGGGTGANGNLTVNNGVPNIQIEMDSFGTKNLPTTLTVKQGNFATPFVYSTTAVKQIQYSGNGKVFYGYDGQTKMYDSELGAYIPVTNEGWSGKWYTSPENDTLCAGKLEWDMSSLTWSAINPYEINTSVGTGTVGMKLSNGVVNDYVLNNIKVVLKDRKLTQNVLSGSLISEFDIIDITDIVAYFNDISMTTTVNNSTVHSGTGLTLKFGTGNAEKFYLAPENIKFDLQYVDEWIKTNKHKYDGQNIRVPITFTRNIGNPQADDGRETISNEVIFRISIKKLELVGVKLNYPIELNPYKDFAAQMIEKFGDGKNRSVLAYFRTSTGMLTAPKEIFITNDSFTKDSNAKVKFDLTSLYGNYGYGGDSTQIRVMIGSKNYGYQSAALPVRMFNSTISGLSRTVTIDNVNLLDTNTIKYGENSKALQVEINGNVLDLVWLDTAKLMQSSGLTNVYIDAIVNYKQKGETDYNKYLNQKIRLLIKNIESVQNVVLESFNGKSLSVDKDGNYVLPADLTSNTGDLVYRYNGNIRVTLNNVKLNINPITKKASYSIGLFDFNFVVGDTVTKVSGFYETNAAGELIESRDFKLINDVYTVSYSFIEILPKKLMVEWTVPVIDSTGAIVKTKVYTEVVLDSSTKDDKDKEPTIGYATYGIYTIKVQVTK